MVRTDGAKQKLTKTMQQPKKHITLELCENVV